MTVHFIAHMRVWEKTAQNMTQSNAMQLLKCFNDWLSTIAIDNLPSTIDCNGRKVAEKLTTVIHITTSLWTLNTEHRTANAVSVLCCVSLQLRTDNIYLIFHTQKLMPFIGDNSSVSFLIGFHFVILYFYTDLSSALVRFFIFWFCYTAMGLIRLIR